MLLYEAPNYALKDLYILFISFFCFFLAYKSYFDKKKLILLAFIGFGFLSYYMDSFLMSREIKASLSSNCQYYKCEIIQGRINSIYLYEGKKKYLEEIIDIGGSQIIMSKRNRKFGYNILNKDGGVLIENDNVYTIYFLDGYIIYISKFMDRK